MKRHISIGFRNPLIDGFFFALGISLAIGLFQSVYARHRVVEAAPLRVEFAPKWIEPHYQPQEYRGPA